MLLIFYGVVFGLLSLLLAYCLQVFWFVVGGANGNWRRLELLYLYSSHTSLMCASTENTVRTDGRAFLMGSVCMCVCMCAPTCARRHENQLHK